MNYPNQQAKDATIAELKQKLAEAEAIPVSVSGLWKPKVGDKYWLIGSIDQICYDVWEDTSTDQLRADKINCFPTREAAQEEADRNLIDRELRAYCKECNAGEEVDLLSYDQPKSAAQDMIDSYCLIA
jgi:hypothetical protein